MHNLHTPHLLYSKTRGHLMVCECTVPTYLCLKTWHLIIFLSVSEMRYLPFSLPYSGRPLPLPPGRSASGTPLHFQSSRLHFQSSLLHCLILFYLQIPIALSFKNWKTKNNSLSEKKKSDFKLLGWCFCLQTSTWNCFPLINDSLDVYFNPVYRN